jgi:MFS family permease
VAMGLNMPSLLSLLTGLAPLEQRAGFLAINGMVLRLGQTLGPVVMGALFAWGGLRAPFWGGAVLGLLTLFLVGATVPRNMSQQPTISP